MLLYVRDHPLLVAGVILLIAAAIAWRRQLLEAWRRLKPSERVGIGILLALLVAVVASFVYVGGV
jgi:hypothetical protein